MAVSPWTKALAASLIHSSLVASTGTTTRHPHITARQHIINVPLQTILASIGPDTLYLSEQDKTTKWIGVNSYFEPTTTITTTATHDGSPKEIPVPVGFSVSTNAEGEIDVAISDAVKSQLEAALNNVPACPLRKRQNPGICNVPTAVTRIVENENLATQLEAFAAQVERTAMSSLEAIAELRANGKMLSFLPPGMAEMAETIFQLLGLGVTTISRPAVGIVASFIVMIMIGKAAVGAILHKISMGFHQAVDAPPPIKGGGNGGEPPKPEESSKACPDRKPLCEGDKCKGVNSEAKCTTNDYKGCDCLFAGDGAIADNLPEGWYQWVKEFHDFVPAPEPPPNKGPPAPKPIKKQCLRIISMNRDHPNPLDLRYMTWEFLPQFARAYTMKIGPKDGDSWGAVFLQEDGTLIGVSDDDKSLGTIYITANDLSGMDLVFVGRDPIPENIKPLKCRYEEYDLVCSAEGRPPSGMRCMIGNDKMKAECARGDNGEPLVLNLKLADVVDGKCPMPY